MVGLFKQAGGSIGGTFHPAAFRVLAGFKKANKDTQKTIRVFACFQPSAGKFARPFCSHRKPDHPAIVGMILIFETD